MAEYSVEIDFNELAESGNRDLIDQIVVDVIQKIEKTKSLDLKDLIAAAELVDLDDEDLSFAHLADQDLAGISFRRTKFVSADCRNAVFSHCDLREADFSDAILDGAWFGGAQTEGTIGLPDGILAAPQGERLRAKDMVLNTGDGSTRFRAYPNYDTAPLFAEAVNRGEGTLAKSGALVVTTGKHTGRSARDKFIVRDAETEDTVWWGNLHRAMTSKHFETLKADFLAKVAERDDLFVQDLFYGGEPANRLKIRAVNELAWHSLVIQTLLIRPKPSDLADFSPDFTLINLPSFKADPERHGCRSETIIAVSFSEKLILIGGTAYAGEMKQAVASVYNYLLPVRGILPMHCAANVGYDGDTALFFGLSGTGKTTLSADSSRTLIGDSWHGWSDTAVFGFEGGCYAKMINLSSEAEPEIFATTQRFGTVLENVVMDPETRELDFDDNTLAENSRGTYPLAFIANVVENHMGLVPRNIVFLTADAFGVLPPIAKLTPQQAMYHFLSGYTAKVAGAEIGVTEPEATFSTCFGAPFMPRHPSVYGNLLKERIAKGGVDCWLVNTGWSGGKAGDPGIKRMPIRVIRALLHAAFDGTLQQAEFRKDPNFGVMYPVNVRGLEGISLDPREHWAIKADYDATAARLVDAFAENFAQFSDHVDEGLRRS